MKPWNIKYRPAERLKHTFFWENYIKIYWHKTNLLNTAPDTAFISRLTQIKADSA